MVSGRSSSSSSKLVLLLALLFFTSLTLASKPASFCKCTCFSNSTIIPLEPADPEASSPPFDDVLQRAERGFGSSEGEETYTLHRRGSQYQARSCNDCTRKFCLNYDLPMCKRAKEDDVFTSCFQRDSRKDEVVVFLFIFATGGLLGWAVFKPWIERYMEAARERRSYMPVAETG